MSSRGAKFQLNLLGPFRLLAPDGQRIDVSSKKGQALIAMLAVAGGGERTRSWLQTRLWGSRGADQAQASLRSELSALRNRINAPGSILASDHNRLWLDLSLIDVDAREMGVAEAAEFLEGLDIAGEDGFEDWLREERARREAQAQKHDPAGLILQTARMAVAAPQMTTVFSALPAIAVLPFANRTADPALDYLAEGLSEDLIDRLSRLRWLPVIARSSSFSARDVGDGTAEVGRKLGARYLLEGNIRRSSAGESLSLSLTDNDAQRVIWSNRIALEKDASPKVMDDMLSDISAHLGAHIDVAEQQRALGKQQCDLNVRDLIWQGRWHLNRLTKEDSDRAKQLFAEAVEREPNSPEALIQSILAGLWEVWAERRSSADTIALRRLAQRAIIADLEDARGHMIAGIAEMWLKQPIRAETLLRHAISLNPSLVLAYAQLGSVLYLKGEPEAAIEPLNIAVRLSPNDYSLFYTQGELAMAHLMIGNFERAVSFADHAIMRRSAYWYGHVIKINALVRGGEQERAKLALEELRTTISQFKEGFVDWLPFIDPKWNGYLKEGLNLAAR